MSQNATPLLTQLYQCAARSHAAFYAPGHKRGQGIAESLRHVMGDRVFQADVPELPELDNLFAPQGVLLEAQQLAAEAFGAGQTWFLTNGSTCGIEAAILATCQPGDRILLPRNCHRSAIAALILSGAMPVFLTPDYDPAWGIPGGVSPSQIETALQAHPDIAAVFLVSPTYHGVCSDLSAIAPMVHARHLPLIVDEAHGGHFAFHPALPSAALRAGADVVIQSTHKVLGAMTQASMLHQSRASCITNSGWSDRLSSAVQMVQSTSPSYLLLASLDAARHQMAIQGHALLEQTITLAQRVQQAVRQIPGLTLLGDRTFCPGTGFAAHDPTRLTVAVQELGLTGFEADEYLHTHCHVTAELPELTNLTFILTFGNTAADIEQLIAGLHALPRLSPRPPLGQRPLLDAPPLAMSPRDAFFAPAALVPLDQSVGRISSGIVCPYPPGIPVVIPGEQMTAEAITFLNSVQAAGGVITGLINQEGQSWLRVTQR